MTKLFLTSQIHTVADHIFQNIKSDFPNPKLAFISTAAENVNGDFSWQNEHKQSLINAGFKLSEYTITNKNYSQISKDLENFDIINVDGGDYFYFMYQAKQSEFDKYILEQVQKGKLYIGTSAGSIAAASNLTSVRSDPAKEYETKLGTYKGLGLVDFCILPHWGRQSSSAERRKQRILNNFNEDNKLILLNDYQYVYVEDDMYKIVDVRKD